MAKRRASLIPNPTEQSLSLFFPVVIILVSLKEFSAVEAQQAVPAEYVFGDSLVDVGNNNYISDTLYLADFPYNGIDFPTHQPTGRFSNGKNAADFLAEKVGLQTPPPYLSLKSSNSSIYLAGVNFASAGSGILNTTNPEGPITLTAQVDNYVKVHDALLKQLGNSALQQHLSKSLFIIVSGNNDMLGYDKKNPQKYIDSIAATFKTQLQRLYNYGARKVVIAGVGPVGCVPSRRILNNGQCMEETNKWSVKCNQGIKLMLKQLKSQVVINYSFFDTLKALNAIIQKPDAHGFVETKAACCGLGSQQAEGPCLPISTLCPNRRDHVFWDFDHPAEATAQILVDSIFEGPLQYTLPVNMKQLVAL